MKKILDILDKIEVAVASLVLLVLICVTFFGVLMRYIFNNPFTWEEELQLACHGMESHSWRLRRRSVQKSHCGN